MIDKDLGYYVCNNVLYSSKINALIASKATQKPVQWIFHNDVYDNYPWHIEPYETLDELYDRRSREIREKYDYVILSYSGGSDTTNILESFIRQNLHIDEIVTNHITSIAKPNTILDHKYTNSSNFAAEHDLQTVPRLKEISTRIPKTKITVLDVSDLILGGLNSFNDVDWVLGRNDHLSVGQLFRYNYFHFGNLKKNFDKNLKVAIIIGLDKPKTFIKDDKFILFFLDNTVNITTINDFNKDYTNVKTELFYWSKTTAPLVCKQAHVIKRWLEFNTDKQQYWRDINFSKIRLYHEKYLRSIIYSTWNESWFQTDKSTMWWHTEFDSWFRNNPEFAKEHHLWKKGIQFLADTLPHHIQYRNDVPDSFAPYRKEYEIGKMISNNA
jgi:hypothetical protein